MANNNNTIIIDAANNTKVTRAQALEYVLAYEMPAEIAAVLKKMLEQVSKKSVRTGETATRKNNRKLADLVVAAIASRPDELINSSWIAKNVDGIATPQKANAVIQIAIADGRLQSVKKSGRVYYVPAGTYNEDGTRNE